MQQGAWAQIEWQGRPIRIETRWVGSTVAAAPLLLFLHDGLGSVSTWGDFPARLCQAAGARGLVYSRPGYGHSTPRAAGERWAPDYLHRQARELLPALLAALNIDPRHDELWLFGHSDGGTIALLHAAVHPGKVQGIFVLAPHIEVEEVTVRSIQQARRDYQEGDLRSRLARHHADPDAVFWGWNDIWLAPAFRDWSIAHELAAIRCPVLAVQGVDDEYGTLEQIRGIARQVPGTQLLQLPGCGHAPHRDQPQAVIDAATAFLRARRRAH